MKNIEIFDKFYLNSLEKLNKENKYYDIKINNFNKIKKEYKESISNLSSFPLRATIQTTEYCNLNCIMCQIHSNRKRKLEQMEKKDFDKIVKILFPYLIEVHPTNIGEALISPWFNYFVEKIQEYGILLDLTTNGMFLGEENIIKILPNLLDIKISFDGIKKSTFETIRRGGNFDIIKKNIDKLILLRKTVKNNATITLQMTLMKNNYKELLSIIEFASSKGIDKVKAYHVFAYNNKVRELSLINDLEKFEEIRLKAIKLSEKLNIQLEISEPPMKIINLDTLIYQKCRLLWSESWIDVNGDFYPCHSHDSLRYGNILNKEFDNIWNSDIMIKLRKYQNFNKPISVCKNCGMNFLKTDENQPVPYDINGFLNKEETSIKWSSRSKQFLLKR